MQVRNACESILRREKATETIRFDVFPRRGKRQFQAKGQSSRERPTSRRLTSNNGDSSILLARLRIADRSPLADRYFRFGLLAVFNRQQITAVANRKTRRSYEQLGKRASLSASQQFFQASRLRRKRDIRNHVAADGGGLRKSRESRIAPVKTEGKPSRGNIAVLFRARPRGL